MPQFISAKKLVKPRLTVQAQTLAALAAIAGAVVLPQIFHVIGAVSGMGAALGEAFLPIILVGLLAGPYAGAAAGLLGPLVSHALSGMPGFAMLPFMMVELCAYGLLAGLLKNKKMPTFVKLLLTQIGGRAVRAVAILLAVLAFGNENISLSAIWMSSVTGICGIALQWALLPLLVYRVQHLHGHEE